MTASATAPATGHRSDSRLMTSLGSPNVRPRRDGAVHTGRSLRA
jgi:hypothetical protein